MMLPLTVEVMKVIFLHTIAYGCYVAFFQAPLGNVICIQMKQSEKLSVFSVFFSFKCAIAIQLSKAVAAAAARVTLSSYSLSSFQSMLKDTAEWKLTGR